MKWLTKNQNRFIIRLFYESNQTKKRLKYFICNPKIGVSPSEVLFINVFLKNVNAWYDNI